MSNDNCDNVYSRLYKLQAMVGKSILDGKRNPWDLLYALQMIVDSGEPRYSVWADLGIIIVPNDYEHRTRLDLFSERFSQDFECGFDIGIADKNFPLASSYFDPGKKYLVRIMKQVTPGRTPHGERMAFLKTMGAVFPGIRGLSLVWELKKDMLKDLALQTFHLVSLDWETVLWHKPGEGIQMPGILFNSKQAGGNCQFYMSSFDYRDKRDADEMFLCFTEVK